MADNTIKIGGELESMATGKIVAAASSIKDKSRNKTQEAINGDVEAAIADLSNRLETTPLQFGAKGDGVTDDKPAFIAAIDTLAEGGTLYIPDGIYLCVDLDITKPIRIVGESKEKTIIYNNTSGKPCFKSSINHLEISNLQFRAIPHNTPGIDRTTNPYEVNNGRSGLLYKGEYGLFHDIIGDYIRTIIWLGGDYLPLGITKKGNTVYNITCRKVFCGVLGCQQENCTISNVSGSFYNFRDWDWSQEDGGFAYDETDFYMGLNPSHLVYITVRPVRRGSNYGIYEDVDADEIPHSEIYDGNHSWSKNISITNIHSVSGSEADEHASSTISAKGIIGGEIDNVTSVNAASVWAYSLKNFTIHNIVCLHNKSYRHALLCEDDGNMIPANERTGGRPPQYNCIIDTVICSGGVATFRAATNAVCKIKNMVLDMDDELDGDTLHSVYDIGYQFALYGAYWVEIDGLRITNTNSQLPAVTKKEQGIYAYGGVALGGSTLGYLRDSIVNMANGLPYVGGANASFELNNCTPDHPSVPLNPTSNKMYVLTPQAEVDKNILRENDIVAGETFLTYTSTDDKQVIVTPLLLYGRKEQHFKLLVTNKGTQAIPVRCTTGSLTPQQNPNFDYVRTNVPIDWRVLEVNDTFEYEVWRKDRVITVIFNGNGFGSYNELTDKPIVKTSDNGFVIVAHGTNRANKATAQNAFAEGGKTEASGASSHAEGFGTYAEGDGSHAEGSGTTASGTGSHAEGYSTFARGSYSHVEGNYTETVDSYAHAEGENTVAYGIASHAEGSCIWSKIIVSRAYTAGDSYLYVKQEVYPGFVISNDTQTVGVQNCVLQEQDGDYELTLNTPFTEDFSANEALSKAPSAYGSYSHREGNHTIAMGNASHAEGNSSKAFSDYSHAEGLHTKTTNIAEHASGKFNKSTSSVTQFSIGIGADEEHRTNAYEVTTDGSIYIKGIGNYDGTNIGVSGVKSVQQVIQDLTNALSGNNA